MLRIIVVFLFLNILNIQFVKAQSSCLNFFELSDYQTQQKNSEFKKYLLGKANGILNEIISITSGSLLGGDSTRLSSYILEALALEQDEIIKSFSNAKNREEMLSVVDEQLNLVRRVKGAITNTLQDRTVVDYYRSRMYLSDQKRLKRKIRGLLNHTISEGVLNFLMDLSIQKNISLMRVIERYILIRVALDKYGFEKADPIYAALLSAMPVSKTDLTKIAKIFLNKEFIINFRSPNATEQQKIKDIFEGMRDHIDFEAQTFVEYYNMIRSDEVFFENEAPTKEF